MTPVSQNIAIVQSMRDVEVMEINALERRITDSEDEADTNLWEQAKRVVALLESGMTQRALAASWVNARTGQPYVHRHVQFTVLAFGEFTRQPRPRFRDAYNAIAVCRFVGSGQARFLPGRPKRVPARPDITLAAGLKKGTRIHAEGR